MADLHLTEELIRNQTSKDKVLSKVLNCIKTGWRNLNFDQEMQHFYRKRDELSVENGILMWQGRMIIPQVSQRSVLTYLHRGHPGISAMRALSRFYVWWPYLDDHIDAFVKTCTRCQENRPCNQELPVFCWSIPEQVWERIHIDFAGPFEGCYWLVLCDALSKWIEIRPMKNITTRSLCAMLDEIFCVFGLPRMIVSDNGPQFISFEFKEYCESQGILHVRSSPYHPRTNGLAERLVRTFKSRMTSKAGNVKSRLLEFLFAYRNTPHTTTGKSPSEVMFGRRLNCLLSNIRPDHRRALQYQHVKENIQFGAKTPNYMPGDDVYIRTRLEKSWRPATILTRKHRYSYVVTTPNGEEKRRHADHIRPRLSLQPGTPTFTPLMATPLTSSPSSMSTALSRPASVESAVLGPTLEPPAVVTPLSVAAAAPSPSETSNALTSPAALPRRSLRLVKPPRRLIEEM